MISRKDYEDIFMECFNMEDPTTINALTSMNEAQKDNVMIGLANRLYKMITNKIDDINYGDIELSNGDITKFKHYDTMVNSITVLKEIAINSKDGVEEVAVLNTTMNNLIEYKNIFTKGYRLDIDIIKVFYKSITLALIADISYFTAICVEFIKNPNSTVKMEFDNLSEFKSKFGLIHDNLIEFNNGCKSGDIEKAFGALISAKSKKIITGLGAITLIGGASALITLVAAIITIIKLIIPILRELTYFFFAARVEISDYFNLQKDLLEANAEALEKDKDKVQIAKDQRKWADRFRRIANFFAIDYVPAKNKAEKEIKKDTKKVEMNNDLTMSDDEDDGAVTLF